MRTLPRLASPSDLFTDPKYMSKPSLDDIPASQLKDTQRRIINASVLVHYISGDFDVLSCFALFGFA